MKEEYNVDEHAQHIFETDLNGFFNYLAVECDLYEIMRDAFFYSDQHKNFACVGPFIRNNKWKTKVFDLLDSGNVGLWDKLRWYAQKLHDSAQEEFEIERYEQEKSPFQQVQL